MLRIDLRQEIEGITVFDDDAAFNKFYLLPNEPRYRLDPDGNPVFQYHAAFNPNTAEIEDLKTRYRAGKVGDVEVKKKLNIALQNFLAPIRERRAKYAAQPQIIDEIIAAGAAKVGPISAETVRLAREAMGLSRKK